VKVGGVFGLQEEFTISRYIIVVGMNLCISQSGLFADLKVIYWIFVLVGAVLM